MLEKRIIDFTTTRRINSDKVTFSVIFQNSFSYIIFVFNVSSFFQRFLELRIFDWIFITKMINNLNQLMTTLTTINIISSGLCHSCRRNSCSLYRRSKCSWFFTFIIQSIHTMFYFIQRFFFSIKSFHTNDIERVNNQILFDSKIQGRITS